LNLNDAKLSSSAYAAEVVNEFLRLVMIPDPTAASRYTAPDLQIVFTGKRVMSAPSECAQFNASRYKWVKKNIERTEVVTPDSQALARGETTIYSLGTLYGEWPDGTAFHGNRFVDRYVVRQGLISHMSVWNDSAEWLLVRAGLASL
jgi:hypothetical protein